MTFDHDKGVAVASGVQFGPTQSGKVYISLHQHRGSGAPAHKHQWCDQISRVMEFGIFDTADYQNWCDRDGHFWGIHDRGQTVLGVRGERLSKFPRTSNSSDPWHGYPVSPLERGDDDAPPDEFVERWIETGAVSKTFGRRIQRRKV